MHDDGRAAAAFIGNVLVSCPHCAGAATVTGTQRSGLLAGAPSPARLVCRHCGATREQRLAPGVRRGYRLSHDGHDPYLGLPLWLATPTRHGVLFAFNAEHLAALEAIVGARLRERHSLPPTSLRNATMLSRLPRWMKLARNRDEVLHGLARLRHKLHGM
ncbi:MAG: hypothetical protein JNM89_05690 [Hyphomicrobiaceae bacterium]|nr:hypothetical protein [Hyphomicrobiaceae bacterium]